ncbi:MAG: disulfide bond formation protein B [Candidatus Eremiobacteraeota bacterium]|nr:disulfide bond formation protein B [Candidatus Eremiobacteraeota bacterium]MCW5865919.1 disulfide bond formation protein B [Candidatus Eremiobacteraeota bacterium]
MSACRHSHFEVGFCLLIAVGLWAGSFSERILGNPPCAWCQLQRLTMLATGLAFQLNLRCGFQRVHYLLAVLFASSGAGVAYSQWALHPNIVWGLGSALYPWSAVLHSTLALYAICGCLTGGRLEQKTSAPVPEASFLGLLATAGLVAWSIFSG